MIGLDNPAFLTLLVLLIPLLIFGYRKGKRFKKIIIFTKIISISLIIFAAASPFIQVEESLNKQSEVTLLVDNSRSTQILENKELELKDVEVNREIIATGNQSDLKKGILRKLEENQPYLLVSDLQSSNSLDKVVDTARNKNTSINVLRSDTNEEASVTIKGPESTVPGAENKFTVKTHSTGIETQPELYLDGEKVDLNKESNKSYTFSKQFEEKGDHKLRAKINPDDEFKSNNQFFKTVKVSEKPEILVIGEKGSLENKISDFYKITNKNQIPDDLSDYYTIISKKKFSEDKVADYIAEGNGLVYTGEIEGENSILPVRSVDSNQESKGAKIMLVIDISKSRESGGSVKKEKQIAYSLAEKLPFNNKLGAIAYNNEAWLLSKPKPLSTNRASLKSKISRLPAEGNTFHHKGLEAAQQEMGGEGNIILITDGRITTFGSNKRTKEKSQGIASELKPRLITVGVGEDKNERFLRDLADRGEGQYFDSSQAGRLNFMFDAGGAEDSVGRLVQVNNHHFITEDLPRLNTKTSGYESVEPKIGSTLLVSSTNGKPFLTTWRYGLGRVASFTGGGSDLGTAVASDPLVVTRTISWAVGQPERKKDKWVKVNDGRKNDQVDIEASYKIGDLKRQGENLYTKELSPENLGFHEIEGNTFGYNYNSEIEKIGYNKENEFIASKTGGKVFEPNEEQEIKESLEKFNNRKVKKKKHLSDYLLIAALLVFLTEVGYRKRRGKK